MVEEPSSSPKSPSSTGSPPATAIFLTFRSAAKASQLPSGEKVTQIAPRGYRESVCLRTDPVPAGTACCPPSCVPTYARRRPFGERAMACAPSKRGLRHKGQAGHLGGSRRRGWRESGEIPGTKPQGDGRDDERRDPSCCRSAAVRLRGPRDDGLLIDRGEARHVFQRKANCRRRPRVASADRAPDNA